MRGSLTIPGIGCFIWLTVLWSGCRENSDAILATISDRDTITVSEFNGYLKKRFNEKPRTLSVSQKRKYLDWMIEDRLKMLYGIQHGYDKYLALDILKEQRSIVVSKAHEKHIKGVFLTADNVSEYQRHVGMTVYSQNLIIRFKDRPDSPVPVTKEEAARRADSIKAVLTVSNYNSIAEKVSDYKNPSTRKGNIKVEKLSIGQLPYTYEKAVFRMEPNDIGGPVEVPGAYVIIHLVSKDFSTCLPMDTEDAEEFMLSKLDDNDQFLLRPVYQRFMDSIYRAGNAVYEERNIHLLSDRLKDSVNVRSSVKLFTEPERDLVLVAFIGGRITLQEFLENYGTDVTVKFTHDLLRQAVEVFCRSKLMEAVMVREGYLNSEEYLVQALSIKEALIVDKVDASIISSYKEPSDADLRRFFLQNRSRYRTDGSITVSEITAPTMEKIRMVREAIDQGTDFNKAVPTEQKEQNVRFSPNVSYNYVTNNEIAARALRMDKGDISDIITRKDGSYTIFKLMSRTEPQWLGLDAARKRVMNDVKKNILKNTEIRMLNELRQKWPVVVYEENLNRK